MAKTALCGVLPMRVIVRHWSYGILLLVVSCFIGVNGVLHKSVQADDAAPSWFSVGAPKLTKIVDLPANTPPPSLNIDCSPMSYIPGYSSTPQTVCATGTSLGEMAVGELFDGSSKASGIACTSQIMCQLAFRPCAATCRTWTLANSSTT